MSRAFLLPEHRLQCDWFCLDDGAFPGGREPQDQELLVLSLLQMEPYLMLEKVLQLVLCVP